MSAGERPFAGPTISQIGEAADRVALDLHKILMLTAIVRRDLAHGHYADVDAGLLERAAISLRQGADTLAGLAVQVADEARP